MPGRPRKKVKLEAEEPEWVTRCPCQDPKNEMLNKGLMIQCEQCEAWQHGPCVGLYEEKDVPKHYYCELCRPERHKKLLKKSTESLKPSHPSTTSHTSTSKPSKSSKAVKSFAKPSQPRIPLPTMPVPYLEPMVIDASTLPNAQRTALLNAPLTAPLEPHLTARAIGSTSSANAPIESVPTNAERTRVHDQTPFGPAEVTKEASASEALSSEVPVTSAPLATDDPAPVVQMQDDVLELSCSFTRSV